MERVTLSQVAERAGVSRATASLVLRGEGRVGADTRERVLAVMAELGYVYDRVAAAMRSAHAPVVGVLVSDLANQFFGQLLGSFQAELHGAGYLPLLANADHDLERQHELLNLLREHRVAGLAWAPVAGTPAALVEQLRAWSLEHVLLTQPVDGARTWLVAPDDRRGGQLAAEHLLLVHGCRRLVVVGSSDVVASARERGRGVGDAVAAAGLPVSAVAEVPWERGDPIGLRAARRAVEGPLAGAGSGLVGAVCFSDVHAAGLLRVLREVGRAGTVPVTGYDDIPTAALWEPPLTTVATHAARMGQLAAASLVRRLTAGPDGDRGPEVQQVEPELVVRASCGCP